MTNTAMTHFRHPLLVWWESEGPAFLQSPLSMYNLPRMAKNPALTKMLLGGAALIAAGTVAQATSLGSAGCVLGSALGGPVGAAIGALVGFGSSFAGGWMSNRFHDKYKALEYELNDPTDVLRNHYLRRLVSQAIRLGIRQSVEGSIKEPETVKALNELEGLAAALFEQDAHAADRLNLDEAQIERFFTGRWEDFNRVERPDATAWRTFLERAAGKDASPAMALAVGIAARTLEASFTRLLFDNAKLASENDKPAFAALELMLVRSMATTLAEHGAQLNRLDASASRSESELSIIKSELAALRESLALLPSRLESRLILPDLRSFDSLQVSARQTGLAIPGAVASVDSRLADIETLLRATYESVTEIARIQRGDRKLLARLPVVGESIRDNANRDWTVREVLSSGAAGAVVLAEHRGKRTVFKISIIEEFARSFAREVEAATTLQDCSEPHARFCRILDSKLPLSRTARGSSPESAVLPPYWIQLEHFPLGNLSSWWKSLALTGTPRDERAASLVAEIARTVAVSHDRGVLHRDLKPANILMSESSQGTVVPHVSDFGIASFTDPERAAALQQHASVRTVHTKSVDAGSHQGTLLFMAPELYERSADSRPTASPSARTDVFSLGVILYWLLTGRQERPSRELVQTHVSDRTLAYVIRRATHRDPEQRYASAVALASELDTRATLAPRLTELEDALLTDADRLALEKERLQASEEQRARAERERSRAEEQSARALRLVGRLRWAAAGLVLLASLTLIGFFVASRRAEGERLAKIDANQKRLLADREAERAAREAARAEAERVKAVKAAEIIEYNSYVANVQMAEAAMEMRLFDRVRQRLDACPPQLRGWEWGWLNAAEDNSLAQLKGRWLVRVNSASFSPDGTQVITASTEGTARMYDARSGASLAELKGHRAAVATAEFSPDGTRTVTASSDGTARVWDATTGESLAELKGHSGDVCSAAFSPDGTRIVTAAYDGTARVWDATTGESLAELKGHTGALFSAAFSSDGRRVVTASNDFTARVWDATTGASVAELKGHTGVVLSAAFDPDGTRILTAGLDGSARVWESQTGACLAVLEGSFAAFSPDGTRIVSAGVDGSARVWDTASATTIVVFKGHKDPVHFAAFSPDGEKIVTASGWTSRVWDAKTGASVAELNGHTSSVKSAKFSPDGAVIVTVANKEVRIWDAAMAGGLAEGHTAPVLAAAFSPDSTRIVTASYDGTAQVRDATTGGRLIELRGHTDFVNWAEFSPDGTRIVTASKDGTARVWDARNGTGLAELKGHTDAVNIAKFSPDGSRVITASDDMTARVWNTITGDSLAELKGHKHGVFSAAFSTNGSSVVTAAWDSTARVWDAETGVSLLEFAGNTGKVNSTTFNTDGTLAVTAHWDNKAKVWDTQTGATLADLKGHPDAVNSAAFSPDGTRIVTASDDGTARVWDATSGTSLAELKGHTGVVNWAEFNPDGTRIVTASDDGTARVWDATSGTSLAELKGHTSPVKIARFSPDGSRILTASLWEFMAKVWDSVPYRERFKDLQARGLRK